MCVCVQFTLVDVSFITNFKKMQIFTFKNRNLFTCICLEMVFQIVCLWKASVTNFTNMRHFKCMCPDVVIQIGSSWKSFVANSTNVRFFPVCVRRWLLMVFPWKFFVTNFTCMTLFTFLRPKMFFQIVSFWKSSVSNFTINRLFKCISPEVVTYLPVYAFFSLEYFKNKTYHI